MPHSFTADYLQALRQGHYFQFLHWGPSLIEFYETESLTTDHLIDLMVFNLIKAGINDEDIEHIAIINALLQHQECPIHGYLAYTATSIIAAVQQYMVYKDEGVMDVYRCETDLEQDEILRLMAQKNGLTALENSKKLKRQLAILDQKGQQYPEKLQLALRQSELFQGLKDLVQGYIERLENRYIINQDKHMAIRIGIAKALQKELMSHAMTTHTLEAVIKQYTQDLSQFKREPWEAEYLKPMVRQTQGERFLLWSKTFAGTLYESLIQEKPQASPSAPTSSP